MSQPNLAGGSDCRRPALILAIASALLSLQHVSASDPSRRSPLVQEAPRLRGDWILVSSKHDGTELVRGTERIRHSYGPNTFRMWSQDRFLGEVCNEFGYSVDTSKSPMIIRQRFGYGTVTGIFRLSGDKLEICYYAGDKLMDRPPRSFDGSRGSGCILETLRREKSPAAGMAKPHRQ